MFIAHGSPMVAIEQSEYGLFLDGLADQLEEPAAIVIFSPHFESRPLAVSDVGVYPTIYDFGGFPEELYRVAYPAKGDHGLSLRIQKLLAQAGINFRVETRRGLDHGSWTILSRVFPRAHIPVIAMSVDQDLTPAEQLSIGRALAPLRSEGVLIVASGVTVHNFALFGQAGDVQVQRAVREFEAWIEDKLMASDTDALLDYERLAPHAQMAVPPGVKEHFVPLFQAVGAGGDHPKVTVLHRTWTYHILPNTVYRFD